MSAPLHGQVAVSASAQRLTGTDTNAAAYSIKASSSNVNPVYIGASGVTTGSGFELDPGDRVDYQPNVQNASPLFSLRVSDFYVIGSAGSDRVSWLATP